MEQRISSIVRGESFAIFNGNCHYYSEIQTVLTSNVSTRIYNTYMKMYTRNFDVLLRQYISTA